MSQEQQTTSLTALKTPAPREQSMPVVRAGFFDLAGFELLQRVSKAFASSTLVPVAYQGNVANCMIALNLARRLGADELMVMQNLYIVHGNPGWSSKFLIASVNTCGRFAALRYEWRGKPGTDDFGCRAWTIEKETGERLDGIWVDWKMVKAEGWNQKKGSKWLTMPDQMFIYRSAAFWQRAYAPEISMGLGSKEELEDTVLDMQPDGSYQVTSMDELRAGTLKDVNPTTGEVQQNTPERQAEQPGEAQAGTPAGPDGENSQQATQEQAGGAGEGLSYAKVRESLEKATDTDVLDVAADLIGQVADAGQQQELRDLYKELREKLENPVQAAAGRGATTKQKTYTAE